MSSTANSSSTTVPTDATEAIGDHPSGDPVKNVFASLGMRGHGITSVGPILGGPGLPAGFWDSLFD